MAGLFFEDAAEIIGSRKTAEAGDDVQRVLPVEQQPHGRFDPDRGEVAPRRHPHRSGEGADEVALGDAQPLAELFHAVQPGVVGADILNGGLHQRRQGGRGAVGIRQFAQQGKDPTHSRARSQLVFALLCELADADSAAPALPPLVQAAIEDIRANYAGLYGVEELSERLGVSKSHLVRTFTAAVGVPPGKYLTTVRIEAAQRLLLHREYTLDVVASLCGFSGANYLCRVFKKETGQSPAQWRALTGRAAQSGLTPEETMREQEMYI